MEIGKRMIPYSVHIPEDTYLALRKYAQRRQAASVVRNALEMILSKEDPFNAGYKQAVRDAINIVNSNELATKLSYCGETVADSLIEAISELK